MKKIGEKVIISRNDENFPLVFLLFQRFRATQDLLNALQDSKIINVIKQISDELFMTINELYPILKHHNYSVLAKNAEFEESGLLLDAEEIQLIIFKKV